MLKVKGFALIDVIVAVVLVGAIAAASITYVYKNQALVAEMSGATFVNEELMAHVIACTQEAAHNKQTASGENPSCEDVGICVQNHLDGPVNGTPQWSLDPSWTFSVLPHDGILNGQLDAPATAADVTFRIDVAGVASMYLPPVICRDSTTSLGP